MGEFASKGLALGVGIPALALAGINTLREGGLGNLFGGGNMPAYETKEAAMLRSENAILKSDKYTDEKILAAYTASYHYYLIYIAQLQIQFHIDAYEFRLGIF